MMKTTNTILICGVLSVACSAQADGAKQDLAKKILAQFEATLKKEGIELDRKRKTVTVPVVVNAPANDLEFLLIHPIGKTHEALLLCRSKPSVMRSAFMALGIEPGKNAWFKKKVPEPTEEQLRAGVDPFIIVPPSGTKLYMTVSFKDKAGKQVSMPVEELLLDWEANLPVSSNSWVFLGGRMDMIYRNEPPVFMADYEGNLISTCYKYPNNHLLTMVHERARDEMNWTVAPKCPPPGTKMSLTFHANKPPMVAAREVRMKREAEERKKKGLEVVGERPERRPAREGQPPPKRVPPVKKPPTGKPPKKKKK